MALWLGAVIWLVFAVIPAPIAWAQSPDSVFTISGVHVETEAETAEAAKTKAMAQARQTAFQILLQRLAPKSYQPQIEKLKTESVGKWIQGVEVKNERVSAVKYSADVTVFFNRNSIEAYLQQNDIPYSAVSSPAILVIPVYDRGDTVLLLQQDSLWLNTWRKIEESKTYGLIPIKVPIATSQLDPADILPDVNRDRVLQLAAQHGLAQALVVTASLNAHNDQGGTIAKITIRAENISPTMASDPIVIEYESLPNTNLADVFYAAAQNLLSQMQEIWKEKTISNTGPVKVLDVMVPARDLAAWINIQQQLMAIPEIRKINVRAMTKDVVQLALDVADGGLEFQELFKKYGLALMPGTQIWVLQPL